MEEILSHHTYTKHYSEKLFFEFTYVCIIQVNLILLKFSDYSGPVYIIFLLFYIDYKPHVSLGILTCPV